MAAIFQNRNIEMKFLLKNHFGHKRRLSFFLLLLLWWWWWRFFLLLFPVYLLFAIFNSNCRWQKDLVSIDKNIHSSTRLSIGRANRPTTHHTSIYLSVQPTMFVGFTVTALAANVVYMVHRRRSDFLHLCIMAIVS